MNGICIFNFYMLDELSSITNVSKFSSTDNINLHFHQQWMTVIMQTFKNSVPLTLVLSTKSMYWEYIQMTSSLTCWHSWGKVTFQTSAIVFKCLVLWKKMPRLLCQIRLVEILGLLDVNTTQSLLGLIVALLFYSTN